MTNNNNGGICLPKTGPNQRVDLYVKDTNGRVYVKVSETNNSVCYSLVGVRKKKKKKNAIVCPTICIKGTSNIFPLFPQTVCGVPIQALQGGLAFPPTPYLNQLTATPGGTYIFSLVTPPVSLPPGITLSASGLLSGVPLLPGDYQFTVQAMDSNGCTGTQTFTINIGAI